MNIACCVPTPGIDGGIIEDRHLALMTRMGFQGVRQNGHVNNPRVPEMTDAILLHGLTPFLTLDFRTHNGQPEMTPAEYGQRVAYIAGRHLGVSLFYEIDNEPKIMGSIHPDVYAAFARAGFDAIRATNSDAKVLIAGEIYKAPVNSRHRLNQWFEKMVKRLGMDIYLQFDGVAIHPYTNDGGRPDASVFADYRAIASGLPLHVTEDGAKPTEPRGQAKHVLEAVDAAEQGGAEWFTVFQLRADHDPAWDFGLFNHDESPREVAVRLAERMGGTT